MRKDAARSGPGVPTAPASGPLGIRQRLGLSRPDLGPEERRRILDQLFYEGIRRRPYLARFATLLSLSVMIATLGLTSNSEAVVIGAMLIAPLMTPIQATAAAVVMGWGMRMFRSLLLVAVATVWVVVLAWIVSLIAPDFVALPDQVLARTEPTLLDLGVALAAGAAGAYTLVRQESSAIPGVAVAVALVPPLATVGITLDHNETGLAVEAMLLFLTNLVSIVLAASLVLLIAGFTPQAMFQRRGRRIRVGLVAALAGVLVVAIPLTVHTEQIVREAVRHHNAGTVIDQWAEDRGFEVTEIDFDEDLVTINLTSSEPPGAEPELHQEITDELGEGTRIRLHWTQSFERVLE